MIILLQTIFWLSIFFLFYNYVGYAIVTWFLIKLSSKRKVHGYDVDMPGVTMIIAAYNEESFVEQKILNTLALDYPKERLQVIFITDGSTDTTPDIIRNYPEIELLHKSERSGKTAALNRAVPYAKHDILVMCDANTMLNKECIKELAKHYQDKTIGAVAGEKKVLSADGLTKQEGLYWKYESALKKLDATYHTIVGAAGELFSLRKYLWQHVEEDTILDDFMISMRIVQQGYRVHYEPRAYATETASASVKEEAKRKVRIAAGGFQSMARLLPMLNIFKYGKSSFLYISHRVLRWAICPFCLVLLLASSLALSFLSDQIIFKIIFVIQVLGYGLIAVNSMVSSRGIKIPLVQPLQYFVFMNICVIRGFFRYMKGEQSATWERAQRQILQEATEINR